LSPLMLRGVETQEQHLVFGAQNPSLAALEIVLDRTPERIVNAHVDRVKAWQQIPLKLHQIAFHISAKHMLIARSQIFPLLAGLHVSVPQTFAVLVLSVLIAISFGICAAGLQVSVQKGSAVLWFFGSSA
jgi:hypothetical protein